MDNKKRYAHFYWPHMWNYGFVFTIFQKYLYIYRLILSLISKFIALVGFISKFCSMFFFFFVKYWPLAILVGIFVQFKKEMHTNFWNNDVRGFLKKKKKCQFNFIERMQNENWKSRSITKNCIALSKGQSIFYRTLSLKSVAFARFHTFSPLAGYYLVFNVFIFVFSTCLH